MRIFYAAPATASGSTDSNVWYLNLYLSLVDMGHEVLPFDYDIEPLISCADPAYPGHKEFVLENRPFLCKELLNQIKKAHEDKPIDMFFSYFYSSCVEPYVIQEIKGMGIVTANWYCNASYQFNLVEEIAPVYDYSLVPEKFRLRDYEKADAKPLYCQLAANPKIYRPYKLEHEYDVIFVGKKYGDRAKYIKYLLDNNIKVNVWGPGWIEAENKQNVTDAQIFLNRFAKLLSVKGWQKLFDKIQNKEKLIVSSEPVAVIPNEICSSPISDEDMIRMYSRCKIALGFSSCGETHRSKNRILQLRLRDFEAIMCGAFYMIEYQDELEEFFEIGKEIVCYHNESDLAEKIKYYLAHDDEREEIRSAGYRRAIKDHTWQRRFESVFKEMGVLS